MRTLILTCATLVMALPAYAEEAAVAPVEKGCLFNMNSDQCAAWKRFWPRFQIAVEGVRQVMQEGPAIAAPATPDYLKTWNAEHAAKLEAAQLKVADLTMFPFKDYYRTAHKNAGAPVNAATPAEFATQYEYIFSADVLWWVKTSKVTCDPSEGVDTPNCGAVQLRDTDKGIGLGFVLGMDGEYRLSEIPYAD